MLRIAAALALLPLWLRVADTADTNAYASILRKLDLIESDTLRPGARVVLTAVELNAYVAHEAARVAPGAVRNPRLELGDGSATGYAQIDFLKLRQTQGEDPGWFMSRLLSGERPVRVRASMTSGNGSARVKVERVEISNLAIEGQVLDFLVEHYLRPNYPEAVIDEPFALGHRIDRLEIRPLGVTLVIGAAASRTTLLYRPQYSKGNAPK